MSETRKLVAILVADVIGYSRLAGCGDVYVTSPRAFQSEACSVAFSSSISQ